MSESKTVVIEYDEWGNKIGELEIKRDGPGHSDKIVYTAEDQIIIAGNYDNLAIYGQDTLSGFNQRNTFIFTINSDYLLEHKYHIAGTQLLYSLLNNDQTTYLIGRIVGDDILFKNDSLLYENYDNFYIAQFDGTIGSVFNPIHRIDLEIYPNPTNGKINIQIPSSQQNQPLQIQCFNNQGQLVKTKLLQMLNPISSLILMI